MATNRNYFIISKSFGHFFKASIIIALVEQLNQILDLVLVGKIISADAFAALDLAIPLETAITGLMMLMSGGGSAIACRLIGDQEFNLANRVQTIMILSSSILSALISIFGLAFLQPIVDLLCSEPSLSGYLLEYLRVYFLGLIPMALYFSLSTIVDIDGSPMKVTKAVVMGCSLDLILDVVLMKYLGLGVAGEALANIVSYAFPVIYFIPYIRYKRCKYIFTVAREDNVKLLSDNIRQGIPYCLPYLIAFAFGLIVNTVVMKRFGTTGVYVWGVAYQVLTIGFMMMDYTGKTILVTLGSMLFGCYDMDGIEKLVRKILWAATAEMAVLIVLVWVFPQQIVSMFGNAPMETLQGSSNYVKVAVLFLLPYTYCCIKVYLFQIFGRRIVAGLQLAVLIGFTILYLLIFEWNGPVQLAFVLLAAVTLYFLLDIIFSFLSRKRDPELSRTFLIPHREIHSLYLSIPYTSNGMNDALPQIEKFLASCKIDDSLRFGVNICCEELIFGIVKHNSDRDEDFYFDFIIYEDNGAIKVRVQDVGDPFNPVKHFTKTAAESYLAGEEMHLSLQIINKMCKQLKYNYLYGQNTIYMAFSV